MVGKRILSLDTSVINQLADEPHGALVAGIRSGYYARVPFLAASEVIACQNSARRKLLIGTCNKLTRSGEIVTAHHDILRVFVRRYEHGLPISPAKSLHLRFPEAEDGLRRDDFDDITDQERQENYNNGEIFKSVYARVKPLFDRLRAEGQAMPRSAGQLLAALDRGETLRDMMRGLYERAAIKHADDAAIRAFYDGCEPFRALIAAVVVAQYDRCVKRDGEPSMKTGRNDTFMATYLPLCDEFVTDDAGQLACFREVVSLAGLKVDVRSYQDFAKTLLLAA
jgi:hypothetical protein